MESVKYFIITFLFSVSFFRVEAQSYTISGHIYDLQSREALAGAFIQSLQNDAHTIASSTGFFKIQTDHPAGELKVTLLGYKAQIIQYNQNDADLNVQMQAAPHSLNEVRVTAFGGNNTNKETAGSVAFLSRADIMQGDGTSLQPALNSVPGVRMDHSTSADSRISIRGNGIRSPWGIRDVKIYVNGIPLTETDGTTRTEALDVSAIGQVEVIKGPASSIYGGGTAGVILFKLQRSPYQEQSFQLSTLAGSYGRLGTSVTYRNGGDQLNSYISYGYQEYKGYREHSSDRRNFITANFQFIPSDKRLITLLIDKTAQRAQIPGAITKSQMAKDPQQANPDNLEKAAGRYQDWTRVGIGQKYSFNNHFSNSTSLFTYFYDLHHPLPFAIIRTYYQSYGGRTKFDYDTQLKGFQTKFTIGAEFNQSGSKGTQYVNHHGEDGALSSNVDYSNTYYTLFAQARASLGKATTLTIGLGYNSLHYNVTDYLDSAGTGIKKFNPQATPRIALSHDFGKGLSLHGSVSTGYSPPTGTQISNPNGTINRDLQAEKGINYEIDAKGGFLQSRFNYDLSLYLMDMKGELIGQTIMPGITVYQNSGKTRHKGAELALSYQPVKKEDHKFVTSLRPYLSLSYSDFKFTDYQILNKVGQVEQSFNGNDLTGISPWIISGGLNVKTKAGIYGNATYFYSDALPLNDGNTAYNPAYTVVNFKLGYKHRLSSHFGLNIFAGIKNLTDSKYSSFTALNAVAYGGDEPAYFNPNPPRNYYIGLNLKYYLK